jgi:hypothetical protein
VAALSERAFSPFLLCYLLKQRPPAFRAPTAPDSSVETTGQHLEMANRAPSHEDAEALSALTKHIVEAAVIAKYLAQRWDLPAIIDSLVSLCICSSLLRRCPAP